MDALVKLRIKPGAYVLHDFHWGLWPFPWCGVDTVFTEFKSTSKGMWCIAPGYGAIGDYGNGAVFLYSSKK